MLSWLPVDVSTFGRDIDSLFYLIYYITGAAFILVTVLMVFLARQVMSLSMDSPARDADSQLFFDPVPPIAQLGYQQSDSDQRLARQHGNADPRDPVHWQQTIA